VRHLKVRDIMSTELITLDEDEDLDLADEMMRLGRVRHLPVVQGGRLVGLVSEKDLLRVQVSSLADLSAAESHDINRRIPVRDVMTHEVHAVDPEMPVLEAARLMLHTKLGCLPVVEHGLLIGIVTEGDFVQLVVDALASNAAEEATHDDDRR